MQLASGLGPRVSKLLLSSFNKHRTATHMQMCCTSQPLALQQWHCPQAHSLRIKHSQDCSLHKPRPLGTITYGSTITLGLCEEGSTRLQTLFYYNSQYYQQAASNLLQAHCIQQGAAGATLLGALCVDEGQGDLWQQSQHTPLGSKPDLTHAMWKGCLQQRSIPAATSCTGDECPT